MSFSPQNPSLNDVQYSPLVNTEPTPTPPTSKPQPTPEELVSMQRAARGVIILSFAQLTLSVFYALYVHGILLPTATALFAFLGICGAARKNFRLLIAHFVYSLLLYVLSLAALIMLIIYCADCSWWFFGAGFLFILLQAIGMRHSRILIGLLRKFNGCQGSSWCSRRCQRICSRNSTPDKQIISTPESNPKTLVPSTETSTQTQNQVPVPIPQFIYPQQFDYNAQQIPMFPYGPQGYYVRYPMMPQPTIVPPSENMYPGLQVYKQV